MVHTLPPNFNMHESSDDLIFDFVMYKLEYPRWRKQLESPLKFQVLNVGVDGVALVG